jgi:hypothetical protein
MDLLKIGIIIPQFKIERSNDYFSQIVETFSNENNIISIVKALYLKDFFLFTDLEYIAILKHFGASIPFFYLVKNYRQQINRQLSRFITSTNNGKFIYLIIYISI